MRATLIYRTANLNKSLYYDTLYQLVISKISWQSASLTVISLKFLVAINCICMLNHYFVWTPAWFDGKYGKKNMEGQEGTSRGVTLSKGQCVQHACYDLAAYNTRYPDICYQKPHS